MFPESFVQKQLLAYSRPGDKVFDPFCGRGTTILEGLLNDRNAIGSDINPVGACISGAKADI
jgi:DNA modification methylase